MKKKKKKESAYNAGDLDLIRSLGQKDPLEKGMATSPVFLPRESHGQTMGSQRVRYN